jgi:hypothetical protein
VAAECVVEAETKDHLNWELIAQVTEKSKGEDRKALKEALEQVEKEEDEHLYHTTGWTRELWIESLGLPAVIPPPEEERTLRLRSARPALSKPVKRCCKQAKQSTDPRGNWETTPNAVVSRLNELASEPFNNVEVSV